MREDGMELLARELADVIDISGLILLDRLMIPIRRRYEILCRVIFAFSIKLLGYLLQELITIRYMLYYLYRHDYIKLHRLSILIYNIKDIKTNLTIVINTILNPSKCFFSELNTKLILIYAPYKISFLRNNIRTNTRTTTHIYDCRLPNKLRVLRMLGSLPHTVVLDELIHQPCRLPQ